MAIKQSFHLKEKLYKIDNNFENIIRRWRWFFQAKDIFKYLKVNSNYRLAKTKIK